MKLTKRWLIPVSAVLVAAALAALYWFGRGETISRQVNMAEVAKSETGPRPEAVLRIAVASMISPKETENSYFDLLRLVGRHVGHEVSFVQRKTYAEVNELLERREIDLAFVCSGPYVDGHERFGMELLAVPVVHGGMVYHSYFIVRRDAPIKDLEGLRGRRFAFTDPNSNTGYLVPTYVLSRRGETPKSFFGETFFTNSHDNSIKAVADGLADGAAVDSLIWEYINATKPADTARTRIIDKSPPYGIPPIVIHPALNPEFKQQLREVFLHLHEDPQATALLKNIQIERFAVGNDAMYDSVRQMQHELKEKR
ncbi:MAG: phosphate/phosphite/phosphonate ABC transporter substrate-binding protein [Sterolibacterium sp.]|nr:phosphate/phosphite/phosphonate ABC transporter substrate-binding protein [Sterolibacterium sp.]